MTDLSNGPVERRIATEVSKLAKKFGQHSANGIEFPFPISRQELADLTGTTLHTVSRTLSAWEKQGYIQRGWRRVIVSDIAALDQLSAKGASHEAPPRRGHRRTGGRLR
jgi:CRP-like cAMP-binding protein